MEYDVDLSEAGCGCNAAFYLVGMPGVDINGNDFESVDYMHYCDANKVGGNFCPEFDIMEANIWSYRAVAHSCDAPNVHGHYSNCDRSGKCALDVIEDNGVPSFDNIPYGPGSQYSINTN